MGRVKNQRQMLIQWNDGQQSYQNAYYIFTKKDHAYNIQERIDVENKETHINQVLEIRSTDERIYRNPSLLNLDRDTPILDYSEFFASKRRSKKLRNN